MDQRAPRRHQRRWRGYFGGALPCAFHLPRRFRRAGAASFCSAASRASRASRKARRLALLSFLRLLSASRIAIQFGICPGVFGNRSSRDMWNGFHSEKRLFSALTSKAACLADSDQCRCPEFVTPRAKKYLRGNRFGIVRSDRYLI